MPPQQTLLESALADHRRGRRAAAARKYRRLLRGQPDNADALYLFGMLRLEEGDATGAAASLGRAVAAAARAGRRVDAGWRLALGSARQRLGDHAGALEAFEAALRDDPASVDALFCRATALHDLGRADEAAAAYRAVLRRAPGHAQAANNLGVVESSRGRPAAAIAAFRRAVEARPDYAEALANLGGALMRAGGDDAAVSVLRRAHSLAPKDRATELALIEALQNADRVREAERLADRALRRRPDDPDLLVRLADIRMALGHRESAVALARRARGVDPSSAGALSLLAEADPDNDAPSALSAIELALAGNEYRGGRDGLHFAAAQLCERLGRHADAFAHYAAGNAARRERLAASGRRYDRDAFAAKVGRLIAAFDADCFAAPGASDSELPLFIVGMPRSGTTLVEQILASHHAVSAGGEMVEMNRIERRLSARHGYPSALPPPALADAASGYLRHVAGIGEGAARVTDKLPGNFMHLGLIARLFPKARIVHCRRDPLDTCLSCYAQNFRAVEFAWSCDPEDLAHFHAQYRRLMDHWRRVLPPGRMLEVDYEAVVNDLECEARRIVAFAGLPWDDACRDFHRTERAIVTASRSQVRRPVYASSIGRWRRYGDAVLPLARALDACGCGPGADG